MKVTEHDNGLDIFFIDHFPELRDSLWSGGLGKDSKVLPIKNGLDMTGVAIVIGRTAACHPAMIVFNKTDIYRPECQCTYFCWSSSSKWSTPRCETMLNSGPD